jgi:transcriptional regulator with XRE-family HTH domain
MATSPTVRQRELGLRLREYRLGLGLTVEDVASQLLCSPTKVSRMETGARRQSLRDIRDLSQLYMLDEEASSTLMELARQARELGWWTQFDGAKAHSLFIGLEQDATSITAFGMCYIPGLLQTVDYARALVRGVVPKIDSGALDERVEIRMRRQKLLAKPAAPRYRALLDEAALRRRVGGPLIMRYQLETISSLADQGKVSIHVLPYGVGAYAAADSNFDYLEFGDSDLPDIVFVEGLIQQICLDRPAEVAKYGEALENLRDKALSERESVKIVGQICN